MPLRLPVPLGLWFWMRECEMTGVELLFDMEAAAEPVMLAARLFQIMQFFNTGLELEAFPIAPPSVVAALPVNVQLVIAGLAEVVLYRAPPEMFAVLPENKQLIRVGLPEMFARPPPLEFVVFDVKVQLFKVKPPPFWMHIPPPVFRAMTTDSTVTEPVPLALPPETVKPFSSVAAASFTERRTW